MMVWTYDADEGRANRKMLHTKKEGKDEEEDSELDG